VESLEQALQGESDPLGPLLQVVWGFPTADWWRPAAVRRRVPRGAVWEPWETRVFPWRKPRKAVWDPVERNSDGLEQNITQIFKLFSYKRDRNAVQQTILRGSTYLFSVKLYSCGSLWRTCSEQASP